MKLLILLGLLTLSVPAWGQPAPPALQANRYSVTATHLTPTDIVGERQLSSRFSVRWTTPSALPPPHVRQATFFYSIDKSLLAATLTQAQALTTNVGVSSASAVSGAYSVTFAHAANLSPVGSVSIPEDNEGSDVYGTGTKVFFRWQLTLSRPSALLLSDVRFTRIDSFVMPRPMNIAVIGDSYASGEGAPALNGSDPWLDQNGHRSRLGGEFQAVQQFKRQPGIAIVCDEPFYVACSGASIDEMVERPFNPEFCDRDGNSLDPAQLNQLIRLFELKKFEGKIDALVVSAGGNDVGFAAAVKSAFGGQLADNIEPLTRNVPRLDTLYRAMADRIDSLCVQHVFAMEYPDPMHKPGLTSTQQTPDELTTRKTFGGLPKPIVEFALSAAMESTIGVVQDAAEGLCDLGEGALEFFFGDDDEDDCASVSIFATPNYDALKEYVDCQATNLDNYVDLLPTVASVATPIGRIELFGEVLLDFFRCLALSDDNLLSCMASCAGGSGGRVSGSSLFSTFLATQRDFQAAHNKILLPMNAVFKRVCTERTNWHFVDGTMRVSRNHGLCACNGTNDKRYFNSVLASYKQQGSLYGSAHMNRLGQRRVYVTQLLTKLNTFLLPRDNRRITPGTNACMRPVAPFSPALRQTSASMDANVAQMDTNMVRRLRAFRIKYLPAIKIVIDHFDPKQFAAQFMRGAFAPMRRARQ